MKDCKLEIGERFPHIGAPAVGGGIVEIPGDLGGRPAVLLFYRGRW